MKKNTIYMTYDEFNAYYRFMRAIKEGKIDKKTKKFVVHFPPIDELYPLLRLLKPIKKQRYIAVDVKDALALLAILGHYKRTLNKYIPGGFRVDIKDMEWLREMVQ